MLYAARTGEGPVTEWVRIRAQGGDSVLLHGYDHRITPTHTMYLGKRAEFASGNCMEMAAVAAAIAIDEYHFTSVWLHVAAIGAPGDHAFCMLSMRPPTWAQWPAKPSRR